MFNSKSKANNTSSKADKNKKLSIDDVKELTWTRILELSALEQKKFTAEDSSTCTSEAALQVGESGSQKDFLLTRATKVLDLLKQKAPELLQPEPSDLRVWTIGLIFVCLAFLLGVFTDELATTGNKINLLSPPLLGLFLWNILIYIWLMVSFIVRCVRKEKTFGAGPLRELLSSSFTKIQTTASKKSPTLTQFFKIWIPAEAPYLRRIVACILHLSAMCFGLGLIFSIGIRGWGTAYTAGWESTWLAEKPNAVLAFLNLVYNILPSNDNLFQTLNTEVVKNMRFDVTPAGVPATYWMIRLITATAIIVIIPRLFLFLYNKVRANFIKNNFPINLQTPYYQNIIRQWHGQSMTIRVLPFGKDLTTEEKNNIEDLSLAINQSGNKFIFEPTAHEDTPLPTIENGKAEELWIVFSMAATPEKEVHIQFAKDIRDLCNKNEASCKVLINSDVFIERFSGTPKRIEERKKNWSTFLDSTAVPYAFANLDSLNVKEISEEFDKTSNHH